MTPHRIAYTLSGITGGIDVANQRKGEIVTAFGDLLHQSREAAGLTMAALAERCGVTAAAINDLEKNRRSPSLATAARLAAALKIKAKLADFEPGKTSDKITE